MKIADFGLARYVSEEEMAKTVAGTPGYIAPEILEQKPYDHRCDYWSLGVVTYLLLSGKLPFEHADHVECFGLIMRGKFSMESETWNHISDEAKNLISGLLVVDPDLRFNKDQIRAHPWINGDFKGSKAKIPIAPITN